MTPMQGPKHESNVSKIYEKFRNCTALSTRNELYEDNKNKKRNLHRTYFKKHET
jgi:hypothetical protein